jgi:hypothetical protein
MADSGTQQQPTYYERLGIKPTASAQQIRRAYRDLSKLYHPDTTTLAPAIATEKFQQLNEAYATLSNPERRLAYDRQIGYSRISVIQPPTNLNQSVRKPTKTYSNNAYLDPTDRPLSAGEMFALFILGLTFVACLALVITVGMTKGDMVWGQDEPGSLESTPAVEETVPMPDSPAASAPAIEPPQPPATSPLVAPSPVPKAPVPKPSVPKAPVPNSPPPFIPKTV